MPNCKSCGAPMIWVKTALGKRIPIDAEPHREGNIAIVGGLMAYVPKDRIEQITGDGVKLYRSHFATCPDHQKWRKPDAE